ncbi:endonuclease/exonuclease/phosphatase family protein [Nesterenkonia marinintestina]|uniref:endonuclease/exonuclease/phosphatase family protein n=1 Tax=Nesterenkonia marinintestina TaxID=2979865 RepID=UPI0021C12A24|nr:endonuclease/exonuclease/phosphatase family protein [Nesterenkonia sp. GX14115]
MPFDGSGAKTGRSPLCAVVPFGLAASLLLMAGADPSHAGHGGLAHSDGGTVSAHPDAQGPAQSERTSRDEGPAADSTAEVAADGVLRVAAARTSFDAESAAEAGDELEGGEDETMRETAALVQQARPDVLVITGVPYDGTHRLAEVMNSQYLAVDQQGQEGLAYAYMYTAPTNSGVDSGADLDGDGFIGGEGDALGEGDYAGQYGMVVLSLAPIDEDEVRTFQDFLWDDMPGNVMPDGSSSVERSVLPLYGATLWDVPITVEDRTLHVIAAARASAGFSDRGPALMVDQRRFIDDYVSEEESDAEYIYDDEGDRGGFDGEQWIVAGDDGLGAGTIRSHSELPEEDASTETEAETRLTWADLRLD